jgi:hypothetical protein
MLVKNLYKNLVLHIPVVVFKIKFAFEGENRVENRQQGETQPAFLDQKVFTV